ncbi:MAG: DNA replication/repair protein RecF [Pseudomonadota bacterium]
MGSVLFVEHLTLSHFRSHKVVRLALDGRPVVLFGANGAGKTNVLEAVSLLSPGRGLRRAAAEDMTRQPDAIGWKVMAGAGGHEIETWSEAGSPRQVRINDKAATQAALGSLVRVLWLIPAMDRLWIEGAEGRRRFLDRMTLSFHPGHGEKSLAYEKAMRERNRLLKDQVSDPVWYRALEGQMAEAGEAITAARMSALAALTAAQEDAETAFPTADLVLTHPDTALPPRAEDLAAAWADTRRRDIAAGRTLIGPHRVDMEGTYRAKGVAAKASSTGEQKALLVSLILANARALAADIGTPPLLLLDEVAAHLDAGRQAALYDEICALGAQAWMTGTGAELFTALGDRAQYFEVTETDGQSEVQAL